MTSVDGEEAADVELGSLLDAGDGAIVTLVAGDTRLAAYRAVLAARSPVFEAMFRQDTLEASSGQVCIADVEGPVLRHLLVYMYTRRAAHPLAVASQMLVAADKYGLLGLKATCEQQVAAQLTAENAATAAVLAVRHSCPGLTDAVATFVKGHTYQVMVTQTWADVVLNHPEVVAEVSRLLAQPSAEIRSLAGPVKGMMLIQTAKEGAAEKLQTLLDAGADVEARDGDMMTALHWAAEGGHVQAVKCLLQGRAPVDARNSWHSTPLHYAAENGHAAVVRLLLSSCADHSARGSVGRTPLHYAAQCGHTEAARALLEGGASKETKTDKGKTPLDYARENQQMLIDLLK